MNRETAELFIGQFSTPAFLVCKKDYSVAAFNSAASSFAPNTFAGGDFCMAVCGLGKKCYECSRNYCSFASHRTYELTVDDDEMFLSVWSPDGSDICLLDDIDINKGFTNFAENIDSYISVLRVYHDVAAEKIELIRSLYEKKDYENLRIEVHGIKGTSYVIGASLIGDSFKELEYACRDYIENNDENGVKTVDEKLESYLKDYSVLVDKLGVFSEASEEAPSEELSDEEFSALVANAVEKMEAYELEEAEELLNKIENVSVSDERKLLVAKAVTEYRNFDYDKCCYYLKQL